MKSRAPRAFALAGAVAALGFALTPPAARADATWLESGDVVLRNDLLLLNDAGVIRTPVSHWPIPRESVRYALEHAQESHATNAALKVALRRLHARVEEGDGLRFTGTVRAGEAGLLRDFDTLARSDGELTAGLEFGNDRVAGSLNLTGAVDPADDKELRADGSHLTLAWGNWLLSAQTLDRWWGPAHESSLILSSNARPMPTLLVERAQARPFESKWLSWLGPWRFSFGLSRMESEREDIDAPLFMAWRVVVMPFKKIELGFSRTAQFCGKQLPCDLDTFGNLLVGNDNPGFDSTLETEPGNQMAGFDIRWTSPIGNLPYAVYGQMIGEDESGYLPVKYLAQFGFEIWKPMAGGGLLQTYAEYADTSCSAISKHGPYFNCAYNQTQFNVEGYRYYGRSVGHTADRDARVAAIGASYTLPDGGLWTTTLRGGELNRDHQPDDTNTVSTVPAKYSAFELGWRSHAWGGTLGLDLGVEALRPEGQDRDVEPYGFLSWSHEFEP